MRLAFLRYGGDLLHPPRPGSSFHARRAPQPSGFRVAHKLSLRRRRCEVEASESLRNLLTRFVLSSCVLFGALLGSGAFLLHQQVAGWSGLILTVVSLSLLLRGRHSRLAVE